MTTQITPIAEYRVLLIDILVNAGTIEYDPLDNFTVAELEDYVISSGHPMPIVILPEHYLRGKKWFTNWGMTELCACGAVWPCPLVPDAAPVDAPPLG